MLCHGFSCTETARNSSCTALCDREQSIKDTLAGDKRNACRVTYMSRPRDTDRPFLCECEVSGASVAKLDGHDRLQNSVISVRSSFDNGTFGDVWRYHRFMKDRSGFLCFGNDRARTYNVSFFYSNVCVPFFFCIKRIYADTTGNIFSGSFCNFFQRTLDTIKNIVDDTRSEKYGNSIAGTDNGFARTKSCCFFEYLNGGHAFFQTDDFADKMIFANIDHFGNLESGVTLQIDNRTVDAINNTCFIHGSFLRQI